MVSGAVEVMMFVGVKEMLKPGLRSEYDVGLVKDPSWSCSRAAGGRLPLFKIPGN